MKNSSKKIFLEKIIKNTKKIQILVIILKIQIRSKKNDRFLNNSSKNKNVNKI